MQLIVVSRLMDTELWLQGKDMHWHTLLAGVVCSYELDSLSKQQANQQFSLFLKKFFMNGFNPSMSCWKLGRKPRLGQVDGTHRLGCLLSQQRNFWIPVQILLPEDPAWFSESCKSYFVNKGIEKRDLDQIMERYGRLHDEIRTLMSGYMDSSFLERYHKIIIEIFMKRCKRFYIEREFAFCQVFPKLKRHLKIEKKPNNVERIVSFQYELKYQDMYYSDGTIRSKVVDQISLDLEKTLGEGWFYLSNTISESVWVESLFEELKANH